MQDHQWITLTKFQAFWAERKELSFLEAARLFRIQRNLEILKQEISEDTERRAVEDEFQRPGIWQIDENGNLKPQSEDAKDEHDRQSKLLEFPARGLYCLFNKDVSSAASPLPEQVKARKVD